MEAPTEADPVEPLSAEVLAQRLECGGVEKLHLMERGGAVFAISRPDRGSFREYPAFQAWPGIAGEPLVKTLKVLSKFEPASGPTAYSFFTSPTDLLGGLTPIEALIGRLITRRELEPQASELLASPSERRLEVVLGAAGAFAATSMGW